MSESLDGIFMRHGADKGSGWHNYSPHYERLFEPIRNERLMLIEFGVQFGPSIKAWLDYFPNARVVGVDIANDFPCDHPRYRFFQGDQSNADLIKSIADTFGGFDIAIDDAGHYAVAQQACLMAMWQHMRPNSTYFIEDTYTLPDPAWNQQQHAAELVFEIFSAVNGGGKRYHGRPGGIVGKFNHIEESLRSVEMHPGIVILKKK